MAIAYKNLFIAPILLVFITFLILKLNGNIDWLWSIIFIPIWVVFFLVFIWTCHYISSVQTSSVSTLLYNINIVLYLIIYVCLLFFSIVFAIQLDGVITWDWFIIFIPIWIIFCMWIYWWYSTQKKNDNGSVNGHQHYELSLRTNNTREPFITNNMNPFHPQLIHNNNYLHHHQTQMPYNNLNEPQSSHIEFGFTLKTYQFIISIGFIVFFVFLPLQLDLTNKWNWAFVFIPLWVSLAVWLWSLISYTVIKTNANYNVHSVYDVPLWIELIIYYTICISLILFSILLTVHLNGKALDYITLFSPVLICLVVDFLICFFYIHYYEREFENNHIESIRTGVLIQFNKN
jgi:hypothetical protein